MITHPNAIYLTNGNWSYHIIMSIWTYISQWANAYYLLIGGLLLWEFNDFRAWTHFITCLGFMGVSVSLDLWSVANKLTEQDKINHSMVQIWRDGCYERIQLQDVQLNDKFNIGLNSEIPADLEITEMVGNGNEDIKCNELSLTGENLIISKSIGDVIYRGTQIIDGYAHGQVIAVGHNCRIYNICQSGLQKPVTPFHDDIQFHTQELMQLMLTLITILWIPAMFITGYSFLRTGLRLVLLISTLIPLSLPFNLASIYRVSSHCVGHQVNQHGVDRYLIHPDEIITDKTGTLTTGHMRLVSICVRTGSSPHLVDLIDENSNVDRQDIKNQLIRDVACSQVQSKYFQYGDPLESEIIKTLSQKCQYELVMNSTNVFQLNGDHDGTDADSEKDGVVIYREFSQPYSYDLGLKFTVINYDGKYFICIQGNPESIEKYCPLIQRKGVIDPLINDGSYREIRSAHAEITLDTVNQLRSNLDKSDVLQNLSFTNPTRYLFSDDLRPGTVEAISEIRRTTPILITMLTGDRQETAIAVAYSSGLFSNHKLPVHCIETHEDLLQAYPLTNNSDSCSPESSSNAYLVLNAKLLTNQDSMDYLHPMMRWQQHIQAIVIYRATPSDKFLWVKIKQNCFKRVMMIGDGLNDYSAISQSDIGVGVGVSGETAIKNTADLVVSGWSEIPQILQQNRKYAIMTEHIAQLLIFRHLSTAGQLLMHFLITGHLRDPNHPLTMVGFNFVTYIMFMGALWYPSLPSNPSTSPEPMTKVFRYLGLFIGMINTGLSKIYGFGLEGVIYIQLIELLIWLLCVKK
jgi:magnesium-transporting ATPase (P-type)